MYVAKTGPDLTGGSAASFSFSFSSTLTFSSSFFLMVLNLAFFFFFSSFLKHDFHLVKMGGLFA